MNAHDARTRRTRPSGLVAASLFLAALAALPAGCSRKKPAEETGVDPSRNPVEALRRVGEAAQSAARKMEEAAKRPPVKPLRFDALIGFLPAVPGGWEGEEPQGDTTSMGEFEITVVSRQYRQRVAEGEEGGGEEVEARITDGGFVPAVYAPFHLVAQVSHESTDGYEKGLTLDGRPAFERWEKDSRQGELTVLVADRFLVRLSSRNGAPGGLRPWVQGMDVARLSALAGPPAK